jgi:hypothetical protein
MTGRSYSYVTLRYVHDTVSGEFVNVGMVLVAPSIGGESPVVLGKTNHRIRRLRDMFPDLQRPYFTDALSSVDRAITRASRFHGDSKLLGAEIDAATVAKAIMPHDDSSLQWSAMGTGVATDLNKTFDRIFDRFVTRYDQSQPSRRSDEEVWRPVRALLEEREVKVEFVAKTIVASEDSIEFKHAWKNGVWHVYEPLSLDLADADGIKDKVRKWLGIMYSVQDTHEHFVPHFILGLPGNEALRPEYDRAKRMLANSPVAAQVYEEAEVSRLVDQIAQEWAQHQAVL